jgi:hypothetical protein
LRAAWRRSTCARACIRSWRRSSRSANSLYRLTAAGYDNGLYFHSTYDIVGNRLSQEITGGLVTTYGTANRLTGAPFHNVRAKSVEEVYKHVGCAATRLWGLRLVGS